MRSISEKWPDGITDSSKNLNSVDNNELLSNTAPAMSCNTLHNQNNNVNPEATNTYQLSERLRSEFSRDIRSNSNESGSRSWNDIFKSYVRTLYYALIFGLFIGICTLSYQSEENADNSIITDIFRPIIRRFVKACEKVIAEPAFYLPLLIVVILACSIKIYYELLIKKRRKENNNNLENNNNFLGIGGYQENSTSSAGMIDSNSSGYGNCGSSYGNNSVFSRQTGQLSPRHSIICPKMHHMYVSQNDKSRVARPAPVIIEMSDDEDEDEQEVSNDFEKFNQTPYNKPKFTIEESRWV